METCEDCGIICGDKKCLFEIIQELVEFKFNHYLWDVGDLFCEKHVWPAQWMSEKELYKRFSCEGVGLIFCSVAGDVEGVKRYMGSVNPSINSSVGSSEDDNNTLARCIENAKKYDHSEILKLLLSIK